MGNSASSRLRPLQLTHLTDSAQLDCALKFLKVAAKRLDSLQALVLAINQVQLDSISAEYYMLRANLVKLHVFIHSVLLLIEVLRLGNKADRTSLITSSPRFL